MASADNTPAPDLAPAKTLPPETRPGASPFIDPGCAWWSLASAELLARLQTRVEGLSAPEATRRLQAFGPNAVDAEPGHPAWRLLWRQMGSPLVAILLIGAVISLFVGEWVDAATILLIVAGSVLLGFGQEMRASAAVGALRRRLALVTRTWRDGALQAVPARQLTPGDVIELAAGHLVPADGVVLQARDFLVTEASLTGESFPVEKRPGVAAVEAPLRERLHCVFVGSSVRSGTARVLVVRTGADTVMADVAARIEQETPETDFARGVRHFGELLMRVMLAVVVLVLVANQLMGRPAIESLLFAMALAVGLSPELLPAIVSVSLARGARGLARAGVLVRRLEAMEDLGGMDVLCTDKTGTLTEGRMTLLAAVDPDLRPSDDVMRLAWLNAAFETGIDNPLDAALIEAGQARHLETAGWTKVDELPYDFQRRRLSVVVAPPGGSGPHLLITKGAVAQVVEVCTRVAAGGGETALDAAWRERVQGLLQLQGEQGVRVLALATRSCAPQPQHGVEEEAGLTLAGFLYFTDPPKAQVRRTVADLAARGVRVKMVTGDNRFVAAHVATAVGLDARALITGQALAGLRDEALWHLAHHTDVFAEVDPAQKERIVRALQRSGHAVGYLGDGINDAPALRAADVGISVDQAVDIARESADIVLLQPDLDVLRQGVDSGRRTFANTMKYIQITTSANFGNMVSMALATPLLPFLPLTATQILLNNFLSDLPSLTISTDRVDRESLARAQRWDVTEVRRYMFVFGLLSSVFDLLTFALLWQVFQAGEALFRSGWFLMSVLTELAVVLVLRTRLRCWRSRPSSALLWATGAVAALALVLPATGPLARVFGLVPLPWTLTLALLGLLVAYVACTEWAKHRFNHWLRRRPARRMPALAAEAWPVTRPWGHPWRRRR